MDNENILPLVLVVMFLSLIGGAMIGTVDPMWDNNGEEELGQAICDQEYDMDFDEYFNGRLYCKDKEVPEEDQYDGITVIIKEG